MRGPFAMQGGPSSRGFGVSFGSEPSGECGTLSGEFCRQTGDVLSLLGRDSTDRSLRLSVPVVWSLLARAGAVPVVPLR